MDLNDAALFVRVVEAGSFTAAARLAHLPKSSVSRSVARLEEELGVRLLQRTTRSLRLTDAGQAYYERARGSVAGLEEAASAVREMGGEPRGVVRLTAPADAYNFGLADIVARFVEEHPAIHVEAVLTNRRVDLIGEGFDLAIRAGRLDDSSLVARRVGLGENGLFAAPRYLRRAGRPKTVDDLSRHACVLFRARGVTTWPLVSAQSERTVQVTGPVSADELTFLVHVVAGGAGIGLLPLFLTREAAHRKQLERVLPEWVAPGAPIHVVLPSSRFVPTRVALLRDLLVAELQKAFAVA